MMKKIVVAVLLIAFAAAQTATGTASGSGSGSGSATGSGSGSTTTTATATGATYVSDKDRLESLKTALTAARAAHRQAEVERKQAFADLHDSAKALTAAVGKHPEATKVHENVVAYTRSTMRQVFFSRNSERHGALGDKAAEESKQWQVVSDATKAKLDAALGTSGDAATALAGYTERLKAAGESSAAKSIAERKVRYLTNRISRLRGRIANELENLERRAKAAQAAANAASQKAADAKKNSDEAKAKADANKDDKDLQKAADNAEKKAVAEQAKADEAQKVATNAAAQKTEKATEFQKTF